jgi:hypothetical protein
MNQARDRARALCSSKKGGTVVLASVLCFLPF